MNKKCLPATIHPKFQPKLNTVLAALGLGLLLTLNSGCQQDVVHQRSMAELNQKAQAMMQAGDYDGAISRLEAAHDLQPEEPNTTYNLGVAYQMKGEYEKSIAIFDQLLKKPGPAGSPMSEPEIHKAMAISYEGQADKLEAAAKAEEGQPKPDAAKAQQAAQQSNMALQQALMHYQKALPGLKDPTPIAAQIQSIEAKLQRPKADVQP